MATPSPPSTRGVHQADPVPSDDPLTAAAGAAIAVVLFVLLSLVGAHQRALLGGHANAALEALRWVAVLGVPLVPLAGGLALGRLTRGGPLVPGIIAGALGTFTAAVSAGVIVAATGASTELNQLLQAGGRGVYGDAATQVLGNSLLLSIRYAWGGLWFSTVVGAAMGGVGAWLTGSSRAWRTAPPDPFLRGLTGAHTLWITGVVAPVLLVGVARLSDDLTDKLGLPVQETTFLVLLSLAACALAAQGLAWYAARDLRARGQRLVPLVVTLGALISSAGWGVSVLLATDLPTRALAGVVAASSLVGLWTMRPQPKDPPPRLKVGWPTALGTAAASGLTLGAAFSLPLGFGLHTALIQVAGLDILFHGTSQPVDWLEPALVNLWQLQAAVTLVQWAVGAGTAGALAAFMGAAHAWRSRRMHSVILTIMGLSLALLPVLGGRTMQILILDRAHPGPTTLPVAPLGLEPDELDALDTLWEALLEGQPELAVDVPESVLDPMESFVVRALLAELEGWDGGPWWEEAQRLAQERRDHRAQALRDWPQEQVLLALTDGADQDVFMHALVAAMASHGQATDPDAALQAMARAQPKAAWPALLLMERAQEQGDLDAVDAEVLRVQEWRGQPAPVLVAEQIRAHLRLGDPLRALQLAQTAPEEAWSSPDFAGSAVAAGMATGDQDLVVRGWMAVQEGPPSLRGARAAVEGCASVGQMGDARALLAVLGSREQPLLGSDLLALDQLLEAPVGRGQPTGDACLDLSQASDWQAILATDSPCSRYGAHRAARAVAHYRLSRRGRWSDRQEHKAAFEALWPRPDQDLFR